MAGHGIEVFRIQSCLKYGANVNGRLFGSERIRRACSPNRLNDVCEAIAGLWRRVRSMD